MPANSSLGCLFSAFATIQVLAALMIGLCTYWGQHYLDGYSWSVIKQVFNYHPLLMTIGMIYLNANGILIYRITRCLRYERQKLVHFFVQFSALVTACVGIYAVYYHHTKEGLPNFTSPHSWLGITAVSGFGLSLLFSFFSYIYPGIDPRYAKMMLPFHKFGGMATFVLTSFVAIGGLTEKALLSFNSETKQLKDSLPEGVILCSIIITIMVFAALVLWLVIKQGFKRGQPIISSKKD